MCLILTGVIMNMKEEDLHLQNLLFTEVAMASRTVFITIFLVLLTVTTIVSAQVQIIDTINQAKEFVNRNDLQEAAQSLSKALEMINKKLLVYLKSSFPEPLKGWRADDPTGTISTSSSITSLKSKKIYYKKGGGSSVDISIETNSSKIGNIKNIMTSPSALNQAGNNLELVTIADKRCIKRFDIIDRYAELIFVPTSSVLIKIIGQDVKDLKIVTKYAEKINWNELELKFP